MYNVKSIIWRVENEKGLCAYNILACSPFSFSTLFYCVLSNQKFALVYLGGDATEAFEDVGHSTDARELMKDYHIGELPEVTAIFHWL